MLDDLGIPLVALAAELGDPVEPAIIRLPDFLHALHEARELLELRPLVIGGAARHLRLDRLSTLAVICGSFSGSARVTQGTGAETRRLTATQGSDPNPARAHRGHFADAPVLAWWVRGQPSPAMDTRAEWDWLAGIYLPVMVAVTVVVIAAFLYPVGRSPDTSGRHARVRPPVDGATRPAGILWAGSTRPTGCGRAVGASVGPPGPAPGGAPDSRPTATRRAETARGRRRELGAGADD